MNTLAVGLIPGCEPELRFVQKIKRYSSYIVPEIDLKSKKKPRLLDKQILTYY